MAVNSVLKQLETRLDEIIGRYGEAKEKISKLEADLEASRKTAEDRAASLKEAKAELSEARKVLKAAEKRAAELEKRLAEAEKTVAVLEEQRAGEAGAAHRIAQLEEQREELSDRLRGVLERIEAVLDSAGE